MNYCLTPGCFKPHNPDSARFCYSCGSKLLLKDRYRPIQPLGRGGFGKTFLAVDEDIPDKPYCVIKQLYLENPDIGFREKATELFYQEAVRLGELGKHPQIPTLLAHFQQNRQLYLIQEWVAGDTLQQELQQTGSYNEAQIWELLQDLLPLLEYIHAHRVIHRDIKPANIIRRQDNGKLVLIDFGVAKLLTDSALLQTGTAIGTPEYMAPEQLRGKACAASDLYSLGVTCIHLLTQVPPLDMFDSINDCWVWRDFLLPGFEVSNHLARVLDKLMLNPLKQRYQSAKQVLQSLNSTSAPTQPLIQPTASKVKLWKPKISVAQPVILPHAEPTLALEADIDYTIIHNLLVKKKWKEADQQTWDMLCQLLSKNPGYYLKNDDIRNLPSQELLRIDQLWIKYSRGRFGFSVQARIYEEVGGDYPSLCNRLGWPLHQASVPDSQLKFNLKAPVGHLPSRRWVGGFNWWRHAGEIAAKLGQCRALP
ncbi:MAG: protein kinase [Symploca sp. SIO2E9]|nr:protein kinase [Symploca sp. SIO2E9]